MADSRAVLLLMDFQQGIVERLDGGAGGADGPGRGGAGGSVVASAARAADAARAVGIPLLFVRVAFRPGFPEVAAANVSFSALTERSGDAITQDHPATQLHPALGRRADEPIVLKKRISAFSGSDLDVLLRGAGADTIVLGGITTSGVVLSTVRQAADLDYRLTVLADACADQDDEVHRVLTEKIFPRQASVITTQEWVASLGSGV
ncbi:Isochorismatase hydrolase [Frankia sp. AiPs1]|uniref:cysteine hydrolase family protein n=1 Tax=Frankia sp. AiPa1 TaxID=573492 RepID=UPI00202B3B05|nr:cysteine hydrolase [Frankia sp. AiPa1]MCL9760353.1 cysteine hydrolase [Frankia sp. AiPa1]